MKTFIGIDGLERLLEAHPEFDWLRYEPEPTAIKYIVSRNGELFNGFCTDYEAAINAGKSDVWRHRKEQMMKTTARRRAIEEAFPEFRKL